MVRWLGAPITTPLAADEPLTSSRQLERGLKDVEMRLIAMIDELMEEPASHPGRPSPKGREREFDLKRARSFSFVLPLTACNHDGLCIRLEQRTITPLKGAYSIW